MAAASHPTKPQTKRQRNPSKATRLKGCLKNGRNQGGATHQAPAFSPAQQQQQQGTQPRGLGSHAAAACSASSRRSMPAKAVVHTAGRAALKTCTACTAASCIGATPSALAPDGDTPCAHGPAGNIRSKTAVCKGAARAGNSRVGPRRLRHCPLARHGEQQPIKTTSSRTTMRR